MTVQSRKRIESSALRSAVELSDEQIVQQILEGDTKQFELIMRRHNQRLFRVTFSIVGERGEAEEIIQEAYLRAYTKLHQFSGRAAFATWLTKIAVYEALRRRKRRNNVIDIDALPQKNRESSFMGGNPETQAFSQELKALLEKTIMEMSDSYRSIFMLREIEGLSTSESADCLGISESTAKVRLHRAKSWLKKRLLSEVHHSKSELFGFAGSSCDRIVDNVLRRIESSFHGCA